MGFLKSLFSALKKGHKELSGSQGLIKIIKSEENEDGFLVYIHVDVIWEFKCQFYRDGSPWVEVIDLEISDVDPYRYNVETRRWKRGEKPLIDEYQKEFNEVLRDQWQLAWENFGRPAYEHKKRQKPTPPPSFVRFTKRSISLKYDDGALSSLPQEYIIMGSTGNEYKLHLRDLECSCPDFIKRRSDFPKNDVRRVCKHQAEAIIELKKNTKITTDKRIQAFIRNPMRAFRDILEITIEEEIKGENPFYIVLPIDDRPWINILFFTPKSYVTHGYNIKERRWSHHQNPFPSGSRQKYNLVMQHISDEIESQ